MSPIRSLVLLAACLTAPLAPVHAQSKAIPAVNTDADGVALHGYDPVAYFTAGRPTAGRAAFSAVYEGATYRFNSAANRATFLADPTAYVPAFGGYCAMGVAVGGKYDIDVEAWRIVDGRLYLNKDPATQRQWLRDVPGYIAAATAKWPGLRPTGFAIRR